MYSLHRKLLVKFILCVTYESREYFLHCVTCDIGELMYDIFENH